MKQDLEIWVSRDKDGWLCLHGHKPILNERYGQWIHDSHVDDSDYLFYECGDPSDWIIIREDLFPTLKYEDGPKKLTLTISDNE